MFVTTHGDLAPEPQAAQAGWVRPCLREATDGDSKSAAQTDLAQKP